MLFRSGVDRKTVIHEDDSSKLQQIAAPPLVVLSDDVGLLSTLFGPDEEPPMPCLVPEGPADVKKGWSKQTAAVEVGNQDQFGPVLKSDGFGDWTQEDTQASVPLPPLATPLSATTQNLSDKGQRFMDLPRIVKLKPSSITFSDYSSPDYTDSDYNHSDYTCNSCKPVFFNLSSDGGGSSQEEEEDHDDDEEGDGDDDDVFLDVGASPRCRGVGRERRRRKQSPEVPSGAGWRAVKQKTNGNGVGHLHITITITFTPLIDWAGEPNAELAIRTKMAARYIMPMLISIESSTLGVRIPCDSMLFLRTLTFIPL